jgi:Proteasome subunit
MPGIRKGWTLTSLVSVQVILAQARATTIVVIRTPDEVVIAADSAATVHEDGGRNVTESVCKIYGLDANLFFAVSGLVNDRLAGFSIPAIVAFVSGGGGNISAKLARAEGAVRDAVLIELPRVKARDPVGYADLIHAKGAVTVMLAGIEGGVPMAASFSLGLEVSPEGSVETTMIRDSCPGNCPSGTRAFWFGEGAAIDRLRAGRGLPKLPMLELAHYLVQLEIDAGAPSVGEPIDVLRITPNGAVWVQRKLSCPN